MISGVNEGESQEWTEVDSVNLVIDDRETLCNLVLVEDFQDSYFLDGWAIGCVVIVILNLYREIWILLSKSGAKESSGCEGE